MSLPGFKPGNSCFIGRVTIDYSKKQFILFMSENRAIPTNKFDTDRVAGNI